MPVEEQQEIAEQTAAPADAGETAQESAAGEQQESQKAEGKSQGGFQRRIDKLTRKVSETEQEKEYWRQQALRTAPATDEAKPAPKTEAKPKETDFKSQAEFLEALTDWKVEQKVKTSRAAEEQEQTRTKQQTAVQRFAQKEQAFREATPDFDEAMADVEDLSVSNALLAEIVESDQGPQLKYFLAKNPDEAKRLSTLSPVALARAVGRIEARFSTAQEKEQPAKTTNAPKPPTPTSRSSATATKDPSDMNPQEYKAWFAKQNPNSR